VVAQLGAEEVVAQLVEEEEVVAQLVEEALPSPSTLVECNYSDDTG